MKTELLSPAGSPEILQAVIAAGADAVYLGGDKFSARAFAPNFSEGDILQALDLAHLYGRRIYLAVNTLLKNREIDRELYRYIKPFYEHGLDAIIVQDYGVFQFVKRYFSELPVHISTQMSVANLCGAAFLRDAGAKRVIPARELSLDEIRRIHDGTDIEIECFVHGALCYCYSGQCLMSSLIGGRSGNRGRCAQPCRLPYRVEDETGGSVCGEVGFPLSLKDLCAVDLIPQMSEAGVYAFKIEGRMKSLDYAAGVTRIYREYLDLYECEPERYAVREKDRRTLLALGNRSGFTGGYYEMRAGRAMLTLKDSSHTSAEAEQAGGPEAVPPIPVTGTVRLRPGEPMTLTAAGPACTDGSVRARPADKAAEDADGEISRAEITVKGGIVQKAVKRPLDAGEVRSRMEKTGDTPFVFSDLRVDMAGDCFAPLGQLNELRRTALEQLEERMLAAYGRTSAEERRADGGREEWADPASGGTLQWHEPSPQGCGTDVFVCTQEQLAAALDAPFVTMISLDPDAGNGDFDASGRFLAREYLRDIETARERIAAAGKRTGFCFPFVFRADASAIFEQNGWAEVLGRFDMLWVRSWDSLGWCLGRPEIRRERIRLDAGLYVFSEEAWHDFSLLGIGGYTAPAELNAGELAHMPNGQAEFCVYGYTPVMVSAQCVYQNCADCAKGGPDDTNLYLSDRYFNKFLIKRNCKDCYNVIYNSRPLSLLHRAGEVRALGFGSLRISFVPEGGDAAAAVLADFGRAFERGEPLSAPADERSYTNGHFRRGVE